MSPRNSYVIEENGFHTHYSKVCSVYEKPISSYFNLTISKNTTINKYTLLFYMCSGVAT